MNYCNNCNNINPSMIMNRLPGMNPMMNFQIIDRQNPSFQMYNNDNMYNPMIGNNNIMNMAGRNIMEIPGSNFNMNFQKMNNICMNNNKIGRQNNNNMNLNNIISIFNNFFQRNINNNYNFYNNYNNINREKYIQFNVDDNNVINIKFVSLYKPNVIISIDKNRSLKYLLEEYAKRLEIPEIHLGKEINFLFNGEIIDFKDKRPIQSLSSDDLIIITVIDPHQIIKVNMHINNNK